MKKDHMLVIGGTKGIGRAIVQAMIKAGYHLSVVSRKEPQEKYRDVHYWIADITDQDTFQRVFHEIIGHSGKLNHLIFCQQFRGPGDDWAGQIETNLTATKQIIELASNAFEDTQRNSIVMISSIASHYIANEKSVGYHVVKAALEQMIRCYALVLAPKGIRVNGVSPHIVLKEENKGYYARNKNLHDLYAKVSPMGRMVTAEDVANAVMFLCSPQSSGITGQSLVIDCGIELQEHASLARALTALDEVRGVHPSFAV